jgi:hypothetical protein
MAAVRTNVEFHLNVPWVAALAGRTGPCVPLVDTVAKSEVVNCVGRPA